GGDRARQLARPGALQEVPGRGPVAVAVEQRADDPAVQHPGECLVVRLRRPLAHQFLALDEAAQAETLLVGRTAAEAHVVLRVAFLQALLAGRTGRRRRRVKRPQPRSMTGMLPAVMTSPT